MQISRHWRLNAQRYRLEGFRNSNGQISLQPRQSIKIADSQQIDIEEAVPIRSKVAVAAH